MEVELVMVWRPHTLRLGDYFLGSLISTFILSLALNFVLCHVSLDF